jgi:MFS family permease
MFRSLLIDIRPLRENRPFRRLWIGSTLSAFGTQIGSFAVLYYVWSITHNAALVGLTGLAQFVPLLVFALIGGHLADRFDRRKLVLFTRWGQLAASVCMAVVVISGTHAVVAIYLVIALQTALSSLAAPASKAFIPRIVGEERLSAALAISNLSMQSALLVSPFVAGIVIATTGVNGCFVFDAVTYFAAIYGVARLPAMAPEGDTDAPDARSVAAGIRLVVRTPILAAAFLADLNATLLAMPIALFPVINSEKFGGSPITLGLFLPALALGGVLAGALSGRVSASRRPGVIMLIASAIWGASLAAFAVFDVVWIAVPFLAVAGAADAVNVIARGTIVQKVTPDALRGRVNALDFVVGAGGPQVGNIRAGFVASVTSGSESMILGGVACVAGAGLIALFIPSLRRYRTDAAPTAVPAASPA